MATSTSVFSRGEDRRCPYLDGLIDESLDHAALRHAWLAALAAGNLPDPAGAVRNFAQQ